jgi:hypothetical protein
MKEKGLGNPVITKSIDQSRRTKLGLNSLKVVLLLQFTVAYYKIFKGFSQIKEDARCSQ